MSTPVEITRISQTPDGTEPDGGSFGSSLSDDGRYVAFTSEATNLVAGDNNFLTDVFVHDRTTGDTSLVSVSSDGEQANGVSGEARISADGRFVTFSSTASNLVANDTNNASDVFVHDLQTAQTTRISLDSAGVEGNRASDQPDISDDGRYVSFRSDASNLIDNDPNGYADIFVHDRDTGTTTLVSASQTGEEAYPASTDARISGNGQFVTFLSEASNIVDTPVSAQQAFRRDLMTGETVLVSVNDFGGIPGRGAFQASPSIDGNQVFFSTSSGNLTLDPFGGITTLYVCDLYLNTTRAATVDEDGEAIVSVRAIISDDLRYVVTNQYIHDRETQRTLSVESLETGNLVHFINALEISPDGTFISFASDAPDLVEDDNYGRSDVFLFRNPFLSEDGQVLTGTAENDVLRGFAGPDTINGLDGADTLIGEAGDDLILGGDTEADLRDVIFAGEGDDFVDGGHGNDELYGMGGNDTLEGGFGVDRLIGGDGDDVLNGGAFSDQIFGGDGFDFINGGFGSDRVNGGAGADLFFHVGTAGHGSDWIQDYDAAEGDVLVFGGAAGPTNFQVNITNTDGAGAAGVDEAFVIYKPTGQILWALVDGAGQDEINIRLGGVEYDLLA